MVDSLVDKVKGDVLVRGTVVGARALQWAATAPTNVQFVKTAGVAGAKALAKDVGTDLVSHAFGKLGTGTITAAQFAAGGLKSAYSQGRALLDTKKSLGASWGDVGRATRDTLATSKGWRNVGLGLLGSLRDVGNFMSGGFISNGDELRNRMTW